MTKSVIWATSHDPKEFTMTKLKADLQRDEDFRGPLLHLIINEIAAFHPDRNKCHREILIENLMIDFEHNDTDTLIAIAGVLVEQKDIIAKLAAGEKLFDQN